MNVFYEESGHFKAAAIKQENAGSLQIESISGKRSKIKLANVLLRFEGELGVFMTSAQAESEQLDIQFLWECCTEQEFAFTDLAKEYYGANASTMQFAAVAMKVHSAPIYFYRKGKGHYKSAPEKTLKLALAAVERKRLQAEQIVAWVEMLNQKQLPDGFLEKADALLYQPDKNGMEWKAIEESAKSTGRLALTVMFEAGLIAKPHDYHFNAFTREMFKDGVGFGAYEAMNDLAFLDELPLANVAAFSIDDETTNEIDDAFSLETLNNGNKRVGIHIAAPSLAVLPGSELDKIVLNRLSTVYMPGHKITMLPEAIVRPFSLDAGEVKPALSLYCELTPELEVVSQVSKLERIKISENLRHDSLAPYFNVDTLVENSGHALWPELKFLHDFAESLEKRRGKDDPNRAPQIDYSFYVNDDAVNIVARERGAPMDKLVAELMIYANSTWGEMLQQGGFAGIYRAQTGGKVFMTTEATPHQGLGVAQYAWSTSPLRRAVDLINQRQMIAMLNNEPAPYEVADGKLQAIMREFELTYQSYNEFQTRMERFWCLQYLIQENLTEVTATVWRENLVRIDGMFYITKVPSLPVLKAGTQVSLSISHVDNLLMELHCKFKQVIEPEVVEKPEIEVLDANI